MDPERATIRNVVFDVGNVLLSPPPRSPAPRDPRGALNMSVMPTTVVLLVVSNVFMTFGWYAHLKDLSGRACLGAVHFVFRK